MKPSTFLKLFIIALFSVSLSVINISCDDDTADDIDDVTDEINNALGLSNLEDTSSIENDIYLGTLGNGEIPPSVDLSSYYPPIGNQGSYGTCVAWAVGYNVRTFIYGRENPSASLSTASNQMSPKDLFWAIPDSDKGSSCNGTGFEAAFDVILNRGIATLDNVPYTDLGGCTYNPISGTNAENNKIASYRQVEVSKEVLKSYLAGGRPVAIGARLGDNFMSWNSSQVLDFDTYNDPNMQHAYHAMALCGYDDNKGPNGAFKVVNSWAPSWGDNGYIWVDQDFFVGATGEFCFAAFVANGIQEEPNPDPNDPNGGVTGKDIVAWELYDYDWEENGDTDPLTRYILYNAYNLGNEAIPASDDWNITYIYYNAYDANDYGIMLYDLYTDNCGAYGQNGPLSDYPSETAYGSSGNWWNNINIPSNCNIVHELTGPENNYFSWPYTMPNISGYYYLVLVTDGFDVISEADESNNYAFITAEGGDPLYFVNGEIQTVTKANGKTSDKGFASASSAQVKQLNKNTYSPQEIRKLIKYQRESGKLEQKVKKYLQNNKNIAPRTFVSKR